MDSFLAFLPLFYRIVKQVILFWSSCKLWRVLVLLRNSHPWLPYFLITQPRVQQIKSQSDVFDSSLSLLVLMSNLESLPYRWWSAWLQHSWGSSLSRAGWLSVPARGGAGSCEPLPGSWTPSQAAVWLLHVFIPEPSQATFKTKPSGVLNIWGRGHNVPITVP